MPDRVRVCVIAADGSPDELARCRAVLDRDERARAAALGTPWLRDRFTVAHGALRVLAGHAVGVPPSALVWRRGRHGKPTSDGPHSSLSYSGSLVAVAISRDRPVGVDIEHLPPGRDPVGLAARFFHPAEARHVAAGADAGERARRFTRLWVRKEAVVKAAGGRLWPNLAVAVHPDDVVQCVEPAGAYRVADLVTPAGYRGAVASPGDAPYTVEFHPLTLADVLCSDGSMLERMIDPPAPRC
ncbi:4'-phosphopantetheinyl transferase superfamily protein [Micromonospora sp. NPDC049240]|uniref:4'-phosphopantetheinyl transferase family protein n=1 Tax=Micromonospora sp. NPDC049240 TaxID=3155151 RepID=UPI0033FD2636